MRDNNNVRYGTVTLDDTQNEVRPIQVIIGWVPDLVKVYVTAGASSSTAGTQLIWHRKMNNNAGLLMAKTSLAKVLRNNTASALADGTAVTGANTDEADVGYLDVSLISNGGIMPWVQTNKSRPPVGSANDVMGGTDIQSGFIIGLDNSGNDSLEDKLDKVPPVGVRTNLMIAENILFWEAHRLLMAEDLEYAGGVNGVEKARKTPVALTSKAKV